MQGDTGRAAENLRRMNMNQVERAHRKLIAAIRRYLLPDEVDQVERAYRLAYAAHKGLSRKSGEPYIMHPLIISNLLAEAFLDADTLSAALLHDVLEENKSITPQDLEKEFGAGVSHLVVGLTKLDMDNVRQILGTDPTYDQIEEASLVNLFMAMATDLRVIVIKLYDRLHNMRTINALLPANQLRMARETLDLFVPVAARLGIWWIKNELEDLSLNVVNPDTYAEIAEMLAARARLLKRDLTGTISRLQTKLAQDGLMAEVHDLPEHIYGQYRQIKAHGWENARMSSGLRVCVIVNTVAECYAALSSIHNLWQPVPGKIMDFIAAPKDGLYRSLHTVVIGYHGHPLKVRIRTPQMHYLAQYGVMAYLQHHDNGLTPLPRPEFAFLKDLVRLPNYDPQTFLEMFKTQIAPQRIRVYTPKGEARELPSGATPVDFAYAVHTEVGHSCYKAIVNGHYAPLNTPLRDGDQVEIIKAVTPQPDRAWLDSDLGYVGNPKTLGYIRRWFARRPATELIEHGVRWTEKEITCWGGWMGWQGNEEEIKQLAHKRGLNIRSFCVRVGRGEIPPPELAALVLKEVSGWNDEQVGPVTLEINANDRPGLLLDACKIVADDKVNIEKAQVLACDEHGLACLHMTLLAKTIRQIVRIVHRLEQVQGVIRVYCIGMGQDAW